MRSSVNCLLMWYISPYEHLSVLSIIQHKSLTLSNCAVSSKMSFCIASSLSSYRRPSPASCLPSIKSYFIILAPLLMKAGNLAMLWVLSLLSLLVIVIWRIKLITCTVKLVLPIIEQDMHHITHLMMDRTMNFYTVGFMLIFNIFNK